MSGGDSCMKIDLVAIVDARDWCEGCLTSAIVEGRIYQLCEDGVSSVGTFRRCLRCPPMNHAPMPPPRDGYARG